MKFLLLLLGDYIKDKPGGTGPVLDVRSALHWRLLLKDLFAVDRINRHFLIMTVTDVLLAIAAKLVAR